MIRASKSAPCRVCGGHPGLPRGKGERCTGYVSDDGAYFHCTREEKAGTLQPDNANPPTFAHLDSTECNCGVPHLSYGQAPATNVPVTRRKVVKRTGWDIRRPDGTHAARHVRIDYDTGEKEYKWEPAGGVDPATLFYRAELLSAGKPVLIVEGEKAADALASLDLPNVVILGHVAGAPGPHMAPEALALLQGRRLYLWPDNDDVGRKAMDKLAADLTGLADVRHIRWGERDKDDAADWLERGGNRAGLADLVRAASDEDKILVLPVTVPQLLDTDTSEILRAGLGYTGSWPRQSISLRLTRVHNRRDDVGGLLEVQRGDRHLYFGSFHASSLSNREQIAKY
ncbi:MAG: hypothetical protein ACRDZY_02775, partial [Acidimicrobiales bacterium]